MSLNFTNPDIQELTGQVLAAPDLIARKVQEKSDAISKKNDYFDLDQINAKYTDNELGILGFYRDEIKYLNGQIITVYNSANIIPGGQLAPSNLHFPDVAPVWAKFPPKIVNSMSGLPIGTFAGTETPAINAITPSITLLKTGFNDGVATTTTETVLTGGLVEVDTDVFAVGQRVISSVAGGFFVGTIQSIRTSGLPTLLGAAELTLVDIVQSGTVPINTSIKNFHPGFTNAEREGTAVTLEPLYLATLESDIDSKVNAWELILDAELAALNLNDAIAPDAAEITQAKADVTAAKNAIVAWESSPLTGAGVGKYGDNKINPLQTAYATRLPQIPLRAAQIIARLGTLAQDAEGVYSGSGHYLEFAKNLNLRLNKASGTLRNFYQMDLIIQTFDQIIAGLMDTQARDSENFTIKSLTADADGSNIVAVDNVTGLIVGQSVKICSNAQPVIDVTITDLVGLNVELSASIPVTYLVGDKARLVFQN